MCVFNVCIHAWRETDRKKERKKKRNRKIIRGKQLETNKTIEILHELLYMSVKIDGRNFTMK